MGFWQEMKSSFYSWNASFVPVLAASHHAQIVGAVSAWIRLIPGPWELSFLAYFQEQRQLRGLKPPLCFNPSLQGSCCSREGTISREIDFVSRVGHPLGMVFIVFLYTFRISLFL